MGEKIKTVFSDVVSTLRSWVLEIGALKISVLDIGKGLIALVVMYWAIKLILKFFGARFKASRRLTRTQKVLYIKLINICLITVAIFVVLNVIGVDLTALAIFGSAVGIGVGFGLQKVISNFISGIIILMDKSIQPGDVIAVGDTYGEVVNLEARYISIVTRDGKAHLIPNETLVTSKVENWSYGSSRLRLRIPVGVANDSDIRKVRDLLEEAAKEHPRVLSEPTPKALITEFAPSTINFELRAWIDDPANGIRSPQSEIYFLIWDKFKEHNIEMPFPQREIRFRSLP